MGSRSHVFMAENIFFVLLYTINTKNEKYKNESLNITSVLTIRLV